MSAVDSAPIAVVERAPVARSFYRGMALLILAISVAGFAPSLIEPATRSVPLPLTGLVTIHAILSVGWLLFFFIQATLVAKRRTPLHRRLGTLGAVLALAFLVEGYMMAVEAARRGFDLTRAVNAQLDPIGALLTRLALFLEFGVLVAAAIWYRHRPDVHKRLLLFATVGPLAVAPITHLAVSMPPNSAIGGTILITLLLLPFVSAIHDRVSRRRIHPVSLWVPVPVVAWQIASGMLFDPSGTRLALPIVASLREFGAWLAQ